MNHLRLEASSLTSFSSFCFVRCDVSTTLHDCSKQRLLHTVRQEFVLPRTGANLVTLGSDGKLKWMIFLRIVTSLVFGLEVPRPSSFQGCFSSPFPNLEFIQLSSVECARSTTLQLSMFFLPQLLESFHLARVMAASPASPENQGEQGKDRRNLSGDNV
jgi:hypothetical protein